jgi:serpin B
MEAAMKKIHVFLTIFVGLSILYSCSNSVTDPNPGIKRDLTVAEIKLTQSDNLFGHKLFKAIVADSPEENIFISPLSISMALGMTYNGANGTTREAMHSTLEFGDLSLQEINESYQSLIELLINLDPKVIFKIANSIWYQQGFSVLPDFIQLNMNYFNAAVEELDFSQDNAADIMNAWVNEHTKGKISEIVDKPIDPLTVMFLINAIYFKGTWQYEFDPDNTHDTYFIKSDQTTINCDMMLQEGTFSYYANDQIQIIDLPYGKAGFSMTVILPQSLGAEAIIQNLDNPVLNDWLASLSAQEVKLFLPKFKISYKAKLNDILSALGMGIAFDPNNADFTQINANGNLFISKVVHKTFVDVNEEGTEAAAATSVEIGLTAHPDKIIMRVDHPFVFMIRENVSGTILFIGKIEAPLIES